MELLKRLPNSLILVTLLTLLFSGCYYDVEEELYPNNGVCDTSNITYALTIAPMMNSSCNSCHSGSAPSGNIDLSNYANVKLYVDDGSLYGSMSHDPNWSQMPQGGNKLDDCTLLKLKMWIDKGAPN
ncbi:MAG: hypothetical protein IPO63_17275 [Bacteroidetes bacterium]|nr:hypothetical protein [Bacteroidota bacterium]